MSIRFDQLTVRHSNLLTRTAAERQQLAETAEEIEHELGRLDRGIQIVRRVLRSPATIGGVIAVVALVGPRRLLRWGTRGLMFYSTARQLVRMRRDVATPTPRESAAAAPRHDGG